MEEKENIAVEGVVTGVTNFGAFIKLNDGQEGLVHISEISNSFVRNVSDYLQTGQAIKVKILGKNKKGKLDLSIKQIDPDFAQLKPEEKSKLSKKRVVRNPEDYFPKLKSKPSLQSLEDKLNYFIKKSDEKLLDIKKNVQSKQGFAKRKKKI